MIPYDVTRIRGSVEVFASSCAASSSDMKEPTLRIPFRTTVLHGSLDYDRETTFFYIPLSSAVSSNTYTDECRAIKLVNRFQTTMVIYNVTADKSSLISHFMNVNTDRENDFLV